MNESWIVRWSLRFLRWFCPEHLYEEIEGDLAQRFHRDEIAAGNGIAKRRFIWNTVRFFRPGIIFRGKGWRSKMRNFMIRSNTKLMFRQISRHKVFSALNIAGLVMGLTVCLYILQYVIHERSFDAYNKNGNDVYRVNLYNTQNGVFQNISAGTVSGLGYSMKQNLPGIKSVARIGDRTTAIVATLDKRKEEQQAVIYADASIFNVLDIQIIHGNRTEILTSPSTIVISASQAVKYFGKSDVVGEILNLGFNNNSLALMPYEVTGVFADMPSTAHVHLDFILPPANENAWNENWDWSNVSTYVLLEHNTTPEALKPGLAHIVSEHHSDATTDRYLLEPVRDIHLHALDGSGKASLVNFFIVLAIVIISLACFNYVNLSIARFVERLKEIGVKKLIGATRAQLIVQFLIESFFFVVISLGLALVIFWISWPAVNDMFGLAIPVTLLNKGWWLVYGLAFIFAGTLCLGLYPAIFLSSFKPLQSLKGNVGKVIDRAAMRKTIITAQLAVSILLVTAVFAIDRQIAFMKTQNPGISINQTVIIEAPLLSDATTIGQYEWVKDRIGTVTGVKGVTYASSFPGGEIDWHRTDISLGDEKSDHKYDSRIVAISPEFFDVFHVPVLEGKVFKQDLTGADRTMVINEKACTMFGFASYQEALGKWIFVGSRKFEVIGVVKDYHFQSFQHFLQPMLFIQGYPRNPTFAVTLNSGYEDAASTITQIQSYWRKAYSGNVFRYYFLDETFEKQYTSSQQLTNIVSALTVIAVLISCLGLFGLSLFSVSRRTKEIGIRKVMGATATAIVNLLAADFMKLLILGAILAIPVALLCMNFWLEQFAYRMSIGLWLVAAPVLMVFMIMLATISFQTLSAARKSPVASMKQE